MLSVLVAHSYFLRFDEKQLRRAKPYPPLATLQVASRLRSLGNRVDVFDAMLATNVGEYLEKLRNVTPEVAVFYEDNYNFLSKMCLGRMREATLEMIAIAKQAKLRVIVAGSDASDDPEIYLMSGADVVLLGEGLQALQALLERLNASRAVPALEWIEGIAGVVTLHEGKLRTDKGTWHPPDLGHPHLPAWDLIDIERYRTMWQSAHGYFSLNVAGSRGCSFRCNWCAKPIWGNRYLQRPPSDVAAEVSYLKRTLRTDHIWFADDIFGFRVDWIREFAAALQESGGGLPFTIQTRADLISEDMAAALKAAGCIEAWIGAESGSQKILDRMNKGTTIVEIRNARRRLQAQGIRVGFFIQLGYLDEQLDDILATRELIDECAPDDIGVSVSYPLPGTKFYEIVKTQLQAKTHWQESNDLDMMFAGTYTSDFYRAIRDLLHDRVTSAKLNTDELRDEFQRTQLSLRERWDQLIEQERRFRTALVGTRALQ
jgi:anaerobic magnesium-protoporphyrin IX monomethyl ester cyclase